MYQTWSWLGFLHWSYRPEVLQRLLPAGLRPHTFDGRAWVGVTPFFLEDLRTPVAPALPWFTSFPETNVRTYVVGPDGREGLWFFSLDAARLEPVLVARSTYALPYKWSAMTVERDGSTIRYRSRRRWPGPTPATSLDGMLVGPGGAAYWPRAGLALENPALPGHAQPARVPLDRAPAGAGLPVGHRLPVLGLRLSRPAGRFRPLVVGVGPGVQVAAVRGGRVAEAVAVLVVVPGLVGVRLSHCRASGGPRRRGGAGARGGRR